MKHTELIKAIIRLPKEEHYTQPQAIQDKDEFVSSSDLEKCITCSAVNGCRQNESLIKHHNNPHHSSPSVNIWRRPKLRLCKKQIHQGISNLRFQLKYESIIHNNAPSSDKVVWSESGEKSAQIKPKQLNKHVAGFWCEWKQQMHFLIMNSSVMDLIWFFYLETSVSKSFWRSNGFFLFPKRASVLGVCIKIGERGQFWRKRRSRSLYDSYTCVYSTVITTIETSKLGGFRSSCSV